MSANDPCQSSSSEEENDLAPIKSPVSPSIKKIRSPRTSLLPIVNSNPDSTTQNPCSTPVTHVRTRSRALSSFSQSSDDNPGMAPPTSTGRKRISMSFTLPVAPSPDTHQLGSPPPRTSFSGVHHSPTPSNASLRTSSASRLAVSAKSPPPQDPGSDVMEYLSQLASKESRVSKLREKLLEVKRELEMAELDLKQFKTKDVMMLHMAHLEQPQESSLLESIQSKLKSLAVEEEEEEEEEGEEGLTEQQEEVTVESETQNQQNQLEQQVELEQQPKEQQPAPIDKPPKRVSYQEHRPGLSHSSTSSVSSTHSSNTNVDSRRKSISAPGLPPRDDVVSMGKRVIGEIGNQFYGLVADIRSAALGDDLSYMNPSLNYGGNTQAGGSRRVSGAQLRGELSASPSGRRRSSREVVDSYTYI